MIYECESERVDYEKYMAKMRRVLNELGGECARYRALANYAATCGEVNISNIYENVSMRLRAILTDKAELSNK
jgi:hypothetical protein